MEVSLSNETMQYASHLRSKGGERSRAPSHQSNRIGKSGSINSIASIKSKANMLNKVNKSYVWFDMN